jgi:hypothetical protein
VNRSDGHPLVPWVRVLVFCAAAVYALSGARLLWLASGDRAVFQFDANGSGRFLIGPVGGLGGSAGSFGSVTSLITTAAGVLWLVWQYQATRAVRAFRLEPKTSPGWAVAWWLIPIANLFMPAVAMAELRRSTGRTEASQGAGLVVGWWLAYQGAAVISAIAVAVPTFSRLMDGFGGQSAITIRSGDAPIAWAIAGIAQLVVAVSAFPALRIVRDIDEGSAVLTGNAVPPRPDLPQPATR